MRNCYESTDNPFMCQLKKIKCLFADTVYAKYKEERFGISTCKPTLSMDKASDLKELMEHIYSTDISGFDTNTYRNTIEVEEGLLDSSCISEFATENLHICNISNLIEKINSL